MNVVVVKNLFIQSLIQRSNDDFRLVCWLRGLP